MAKRANKHWSRWTDEDQAQFEDLYVNEVSVEDIARILGRNVSAIYNRAHTTGVRRFSSENPRTAAWTTPDAFFEDVGAQTSEDKVKLAAKIFRWLMK